MATLGSFLDILDKVIENPSVQRQEYGPMYPSPEATAINNSLDFFLFGSPSMIELSVKGENLDAG